MIPPSAPRPAARHARCLLGFISHRLATLSAPPTLLLQPVVRACRVRPSRIHHQPSPLSLSLSLPLHCPQLCRDMAATQQLSMQSRTGRLNQRKSAHATPHALALGTFPNPPSPVFCRFPFVCTWLIGPRLRLPRRAPSRRRRAPLRRQVLRPPHPVDQTQRLGPPQRRLGD